VTAEQYKKQAEHSSFFWELAVEEFNQVIIDKPDWYQCYAYLANIYSSQMHQEIVSHPEQLDQAKRLLRQAVDLYDKAIGCVKDKSSPPYYRLSIAKAWTELVAVRQRISALQSVDSMIGGICNVET